MSLLRRPAADERWKAQIEALRAPLGDENFVAAWNEAWDQWEIEDAIRASLALPEAPPASSPE